jgi:UDP-N-acetylglucosamine:LPS N-acetylglucosamine transferase
MKICIVSSAGGHLVQCLKLLPILKKHKVFVITFEKTPLRSLLKGIKTYLIENPKRNPIKYIMFTPRFLSILINENPDVVITTGAGVAVPICLFAKFFFDSKIIFIESFSRIYKPSSTGKILYDFADLFLVQWPKLRKEYGEKAIYVGSLL